MNPFIGFVRFLLGCLQVPLAPLTGPHRLFAYRPGALGGVARMLALWAGLVALPMLFFEEIAFMCSDHGQMLFRVWVGVAGLALIHTIIKCTGRFVSPPETPRSWFGNWEPAFAISLAVAAQAVCYLGPIFFLSYACSLIDRGLSLARGRLARWSPEDTAWCMTPFRIACAFVAPGALTAWGYARRVLHWWSPPKPAPIDGQAAYKPPTFRSRVMSHIVGSVILRAFMGDISWTFLWNVAGFVLAIPLMLMGWTTIAPDPVKEQAEIYYSRAKDTLGERRDAISERLSREEERLAEEFRERRERLRREAGRVREDLAGKGEELKDELDRKKRKAMWDILTPW